MPNTLKRNSVIAFGLALLFYGSFMFAKHDPALRGIIPFGEDPYDAVGSFGVVVGILIAMLSLVRAFRPHHRPPPSEAQVLYLVRSQQAVVLAVFITLAADIVAMTRHASTWIDAGSRYRLVALLGGLALVAGVAHVLIRASQKRLLKSAPTPWKRIVLAGLFVVLILRFYPERLIDRLATHLVTCLIGDVVLFAPMRMLLPAFAPYESEDRREGGVRRMTRSSGVGWRWGIVVLVGVLFGALVFLGEISEGAGGLSIARLILVASVFVGLGLAGFLIAYAFLGRPLGLGRRG